jgi:hypothetical protein
MLSSPELLHPKSPNFTEIFSEISLKMLLAILPPRCQIGCNIFYLFSSMTTAYQVARLCQNATLGSLEVWVGRVTVNTHIFFFGLRVISNNSERHHPTYTPMAGKSGDLARNIL